MATSVKLPSDDVGATLKRRDGIRGRRYGEIILIGTHPGTGRQVGSVYNTTGLNDPTGTGDSCPQGLWDRIDVHAICRRRPHRLEGAHVCPDTADPSIPAVADMSGESDRLPCPDDRATDEVLEHRTTK